VQIKKLFEEKNYTKWSDTNLKISNRKEYLFPCYYFINIHLLHWHWFSLVFQYSCVLRKSYVPIDEFAKNKIQHW
jgi:hypothetical protein